MPRSDAAASAAPLNVGVAHLLDGRLFGGAEQMVLRLATAMRGQGVRVYCLAGGRLSQNLEKYDVPHRVFASRGRFDLSMLGRIAQAAREDGVSIIQAHTSRTHLMARLLGRVWGLQNITTIHSPIAQDENRGVRRHPWRATLERWGRPWADMVACVSREELERLRREEGLAPARSLWLPNGVAPPSGERGERPPALRAWLEQAGLPPDCLLVAMVAQMRPRKGPEVLLRAFAELERSRPVALLMIGGEEFAGQGYLAQLQTQADALGIGKRVNWAGFLAEPWQLAAHADIVCLPSLFGEGLPLVGLEAMSRGIALLVSNSGGNRELAEGGESAWLHEPGDWEQLARQLGQLAGDRTAREGLGARGHAVYLTHYTLEKCVARHVEMYGFLRRSCRSAKSPEPGG